MCRRILRYLGYHCTSGCGEAGFPTRQPRPALNGRKRPQGFFCSEGTGGASDQLCFISGFQPNPLSRRQFEGMRRPVENRQRGERVRLKAPKGGPVATACCVAVLAKGYGHCRRTASCRQMRQTPQRRNIIGQRLPWAPSRRVGNPASSQPRSKALT